MLPTPRVWRLRREMVVVAAALLAMTGRGGDAEAQQGVSEPLRGSVQGAGGSLSFRTEGTGASVLVVGFPEFYARTFSEGLRSDFRFVFVDYAAVSAAAAPVPEPVPDLPVILADLERVRRALNLGPVIALGHAGHSYIALEYAKAYPQSVSHVVMMAISPDLGSDAAAATDAYWAEAASAERKAAFDANMTAHPDAELDALSASDRWIARYIRNGPKAWHASGFDATPLWEGIEVNADAFNAVWGAQFRAVDITAGLADFAVPVFLALGRDDFLIAPPSAWDAVAPAFADLTIAVFDESAHSPQYEEPDAFDAALRAWLGASPLVENPEHP